MNPVTVPPLSLPAAADNRVCGRIDADAFVCIYPPGHLPALPHRCYEPNGSGRWVEYDAAMTPGARGPEGCWTVAVPPSGVEPMTPPPGSL